MLLRNVTVLNGHTYGIYWLDLDCDLESLGGYNSYILTLLPDYISMEILQNPFLCREAEDRDVPYSLCSLLYLWNL